MADRRSNIVETGLAALREHGLAGLTQPRIAKLVGIRQSLLTYYFPTRLDLLSAVARTAVDRQLAAVRDVFPTLGSLDQAAASIATLVSRHENTRVLMALAQGGDQEPQLRVLFRELADGIAMEVEGFLTRMGGKPASGHAARLLHATSVGLAVITLATNEDSAHDHVEAMIRDLMGLLVRRAVSAPPPTSSISSEGYAS